MKLVFIVGARPNLMKIAPLIVEANRYPAIKSILIHTGQHYDRSMSGSFFDQLGIPPPDFDLAVGSGDHGWQTAQVMLRLEPLLKEIEPDVVMVVGDVNSTLAAALVASKLNICLAHVEAGLRSFDRRMPEEINRRLTDVVSDYLFTTTEDAVSNLLSEGISSEQIFLVGNVMADCLLTNIPRGAVSATCIVPEVQDGQYALLTLHRPSNVDNREVLSNLVTIIKEVSDLVPIVFPVHPRTRTNLEAFELSGSLLNDRIHLLPPQSYLDFVGLMGKAAVVLTDSGGIQEETTILGIPCLTLRESTERPITIAEGTNVLVGTDPSAIMSELRRALLNDGQERPRPKFWDGYAAERIFEVLAGKLGLQRDPSHNGSFMAKAG